MFSAASSTKLSASAHLKYLGTHFIATPLGIFMAWLALHTHLAYGVLFLGAYFEALIGPSFFIPGELFLLAGSILAGAGTLDIWLVLGVLYGGAVLGDSSSYFIGRWIGKSIFHEKNRFLTIKNYKKIEDLFEKHGLKAIFFARLVGPFSKIAPVLAGIFEIPFREFLLYNIPGVVVGCGQFIIVGYFFGDQYQTILWWIERYSVIFFILLLALFFLYRYMKKTYFPRRKKKREAEHAKGAHSGHQDVHPAKKEDSI